MNQLFQAPAGAWDTTGKANLVPVVANGKVFVATLKQLAIFGLKNWQSSQRRAPVRRCRLTHHYPPLD